MRFYLNFLSDNYGRKEIDEPAGFAEVDFNIKQRSDGMARDIALNGDKIDFQFTYMRNHELKQLLYYFNRFGFEAKVNLEIQFDDTTKYICELDFATAQTDDFKYLKIKGLPLSDYQIIKRRRSVKVDLFSDKNVDGDYIAPLVPENVLMLATPYYQSSKWTQSNEIKQTWVSYGQDAIFMSPIDTVLQYDIEDTIIPFESVISLGSFYKNEQYYQAKKDLSILKLKDNVVKGELIINDLSFFVSSLGFPTKINLEVLISKTFIRSETKRIFLESSINGQINISNKSYTIPIDSIERDSYVIIEASIFQPYTLPAATPIGSSVFELKLNGSVEVNFETSTYNSVCPSFGLYETVAQVVKSISGMDIIAPRFQIGGDLYGNRLLNGNLLRQIKNKPFSISLEDLEKSFPEIKFDYEVTPDGKVFFGGETDFYTANEMAFYPNVQFSEMTKEFNPLYMVNEFWFSYKNYQSLKENTVAGSADTIHGESRFVLNNKKVENKKAVEVEWTRDTRIIEVQRKQAIVINQDTTTQDDDTIFSIDCIKNISDQSFTETTQLFHKYQGGKLTLRTDGVINFTLLGIQNGSAFKIFAPDNNAGDYTVFQIDPSQITLTRVSSGAIGTSNDGIRSTKYQYTIDDAYIPYTNRTNQGIDSIFNLNAGDKYSNLRYSVARNIKNFWNSYLATCNLYWKDVTIKNTWYKNNGECTTSIGGVILKEKDDILPSNPIVTPFMYSNVTFKGIDFVDFIDLQNAIRTQRGFIRFIDNNRRVVKLYPTEVEYSLLEKRLEIKGEEKFEPIFMTIVTDPNYILINNETRIDSIKHEFKGEKLYVSDSTRQLLYNGVYWFNVSVNGAIPNSKNKLDEWIKLMV
jgi:hypothetical protein